MFKKYFRGGLLSRGWHNYCEEREFVPRLEASSCPFVVCDVHPQIEIKLTLATF